MTAEPDSHQFYDLESYLFDTVSPRFKQQGELSAFDFFCIIIWKANRAKSKIAKRLKQRYGDLETAVCKLTRGLAQQPTPEKRLQYLVKEWGFYLPTASAILTVLYPDEFTIYDKWVCDALKEICGKEFHHLSNLTKPDRLWKEYEGYRRQVEESAPGSTLRDKDCYLWGRSFYKQLIADIERGFEKVEKPDKPDSLNKYLQFPTEESEWEL